MATPSRRRPLTDSPFDTLERTFTLLTTGPRPLSIDGSAVEGLPDRLVPLDELKSRLLHPSTPFAVRDAAIGELVTQAQREGGRWSVGLAGVLLPGLRRATWSLVQACPARRPTSSPRPWPPSWTRSPKPSPAEPVWRPGCAGSPGLARSESAGANWPSGPVPAPTPSRPPHRARGVTQTSCWPGRSARASSAPKTPS